MRIHGVYSMVSNLVAVPRFKLHGLSATFLVRYSTASIALASHVN
jgi:hypothetical protein